MLILPIKRKWFDLIRDGTKKEEYRGIKPYYTSRFKNMLNGESFYILLRAGYSKTSPTIQCKVSITQGFGREEWGAENGVAYYVLKIHSVFNV